MPPYCSHFTLKISVIKLLLLQVFCHDVFQSYSLFFAMSNQICSNEIFFSCLIHFPRSSIDLCHGSLRGFSFFISRDFSNWTISNKQSALKANVRPSHMRWCVPIDIYLRSMWITSSIEQSWHWDGREKIPTGDIETMFVHCSNSPTREYTRIHFTGFVFICR